MGCYTKSTYLAGGPCLSLRAKLFSCWLSAGHRGKNSQKLWSIPEHPNKFPLRGERRRFVDQESSLFNIHEYFPQTCSPNIATDCKCMTPALSHYLKTRASLVAQWLRIRLPVQGTRVRALVREDPTWREAAKPVSHNY